MILSPTASGWRSSPLARLGFLGSITSCRQEQMQSPDRLHSSDFSIPFPSSRFISEVAAGVLSAWRRAHASSIHGVDHTACEAVAFHGLAPLLHFPACLSFQPSVLVSDNANTNSPSDTMQHFPAYSPEPCPLFPCTVKILHIPVFQSGSHAQALCRGTVRKRWLRLSHKPARVHRGCCLHVGPTLCVYPIPFFSSSMSGAAEPQKELLLGICNCLRLFQLIQVCSRCPRQWH